MRDAILFILLIEVTTRFTAIILPRYMFLRDNDCINNLQFKCSQDTDIQVLIQPKFITIKTMIVCIVRHTFIITDKMNLLFIKEIYLKD